MQLGVTDSFEVDSGLREGILRLSEDLEEVKTWVRTLGLILFFCKES